LQRITDSDAETSVRSAKSENTHILISSCNPSIETRCYALRERRDQLIRGISARGEILNLESEIAEQETIINRLANGWEPRFYESNGQTPVAMMRKARDELARLVSLRPEAMQAHTRDEEARRELVGIEKQLVAIQAEKLDPRNMAWSE
jgi:hypothetical protein